MRSLNELALRNLDQSRTRTLLTALSVSIGVATITATGVFESGIKATWGGGEGIAGFIVNITGILFTGVGGMILLAAGFLIFNAFAMTVTQRQKQIGMLRALGMTRKMVMRLILLEALATGGIGTLIGLLLGQPFGQGILSSMGQFGFEAGRGSLRLQDILLAIFLGMGITLFASLVPARRAASVSPMTALKETDDAKPAVKVEFKSPRILAGFIIGILLWSWMLIVPPGKWSGYYPPMDMVLMQVAGITWLLSVILLAPYLFQKAADWVKPLLWKFGGISGRLAADNLQRNPARLTLTALSFAIGISVLIGAAGLVSLQNDVLLGETSKRALQEAGWYVYAFDRSSGVAQLSSFGNTSASGLDPAVIEAAQEIVGERAEVGTIHMVNAAEISSPTMGFPSFLINESEVNRFRRPEVFNLLEGDRDEMIRLLLQPGCAFTTSPAVASKFKVKQGDMLLVTGINGKVDCIVAGVGSYGITPVSWLSPGSRDFFAPQGRTPDTFAIHPSPNTDRAALEEEIFKLEERFPDQAFVSTADQEVRAVTDTSDQLMVIFNGMLLLAIVGAAFGMLNTVMVSILERQKEIGLLRAVGSRRGQIMNMLILESVLTGIFGVLVGALMGFGWAAICAFTMGGIAWSLPDLNLYAAAWAVLTPAFRNGWWAFIAAPLMAGLIAYPVARSAVRGSAVESLQPERRESQARHADGIFARGSLRVRFALGTGLLLSIILISLISAVTYHTKMRIEEQLLDGMKQMVQWNAGMLELTLPAEATNLDLDSVRGTDTPFNFDADMLLRFEALIDEMTQNGLSDFSVTDKDNIVIISLDEKNVGDLLPALETTSAEAHATNENGKWRMVATAPVRSDTGIVGSVRLTANPAALKEMLDGLRNSLLLLGLGIVLLGVLVSMALVTPLSKASHQIAAHAAEVRQGKYTVFENKKNPSTDKFSISTKLTLALTGFVIALVLILKLIAIPIEQRYVESITRDSMVSSAEWMGRAISTSLDEEFLNSMESSADFDFSEMDFEKLPMLDIAKVQELTNVRTNDLAYIALVNTDGEVALSDQLALIGEKTDVPSGTTIQDGTWRNASILILSTPIRKGEDGEQVGTLVIGAKRERIDAFIAESRSLFNLIGIIAMLAGILLAQAIGGAVSAPVRTLASGTRRIADGDLSIRFDVNSKDELAILANAYNQMVIGLQEREWLRDMFGRFVSQEVAEAIRTGQVKLEGENRVVSVLFCDIRDFTSRSEQHTPAEMVALLNEYLPVVVDAAQTHGGTVNKFGGDSTLVIYGAPRKMEESAYGAVQTALDLHDGLKRLNEHLTSRGEMPIRIGVGINTGMVLAGAVGPRERQEYTVIGDTVNLASRIEALNKQYPEYDILISEWTCEALGAHRSEFQLTSLGKVPIRGKTDGVQIWAVTRL